MTWTTQARASVRTSAEDCYCCERPWLELTFGAGAAQIEPPAPLRALALAHELEELAVWIRDGPEELLADPCLRAAARSQGVTLSAVTLAVAGALRDRQPRQDICRHAVVVDGHVCTTMTYRPDAGDNRIGLVTVPDLLVGEVDEQDRSTAALPVPTDLLEARPDEPAMSLVEMDELTDWDPRHCQNLRPPRPWAHLILVSHVWNDLHRPRTEWLAVRSRVNAWVDEQLAKAADSRDARNKALTRDDYGVWVDFMMVPNLAHDDRECESCETEKRRMIQRIGALLTLATVLPMDDTANHRGWILQELSLDAHGATRYEHRDRISLMAGDVEFTSVAGKSGEPDDGRMLRCLEFVRLGQTPRVWPAVNRHLLERLEAEGHTDEGSAEAWSILTDLARTFGQECHELKRLMAELTQQLALARRGGHDSPAPASAGTFEDPLDLSPLARVIEDQNRALAALDARVVAAAPLSPGAHQQHRLLPLAERQQLAAALQWQQFVCVAMGLRAEWLRGAGLVAWVRASAVTEALGGVKFLARLKNGEIKFSPARTLTLQEEPRTLPEQVAYARQVASDGVPVADLVTICRVGFRARQAIVARRG